MRNIFYTINPNTPKCMGIIFESELVILKVKNCVAPPKKLLVVECCRCILG